VTIPDVEPDDLFDALTIASPDWGDHDLFVLRAADEWACDGAAMTWLRSSAGGAKAGPGLAEQHRLADPEALEGAGADDEVALAGPRRSALRGRLRLRLNRSDLATGRIEMVICPTSDPRR
jgi:hypothetical protein